MRSFGVMRFDQKASINTLPLHLGKTLTGTEGGQSIPDTDILRYLNMMDAGLFKLDNFISHRYQLEDINEGILAMRQGKSTHAIINSFD